MLKADYLKKSRNQKITAWVFLGTGAVVDIIGISTYPSGILLTPSEKQQEKTAIGLFVTGTVFMLTSIPFFIMSQKNKKKAMPIGFNNKMIQQVTGNNYVYKPVPSITFKIKL